MTDRRKDMWRLLYNLVNRNDTQHQDVFVFVDDILCKEPSLIRQSTREATNSFQDAFILWLTNKLVGALGTDLDDTVDVFEMNLRIQRKLLNSCLLNRSALFERVVNAYVNAVKELCDQYDKVDLAEESDSCVIMLEITVFCPEKDILKEIDPEFHCQPIQISSDEADRYIRALLQVIHHGLFVGYINYPSAFEDSVLPVLNALKLCQFPTKLMCLQYVGRVFQTDCALSDKMQVMYELTFRAVNAMWTCMPVWLSNNCIDQEQLDDFMEESCEILKIMYKFVAEVIENTTIESHCFRLLETMHEVAQNSELQRSYDLGKVTVVFHAVVDFIFGIFIKTPEACKKMNPNYVNVLLGMTKVFPVVLRCIAPHIIQDENNSVNKVVIRLILSEVTLILNGNKITNGDYQKLKELLTFLQLLEHHRQCLNLSKACAIAADLETVNIKESVDSWLRNMRNDSGENLCIAALLFNNDHISDILTTNTKKLLLEIILEPLRLPTSDPVALTALDILVRLKERNWHHFAAQISSVLLALAKSLFSGNAELDALVSKFAEHIPYYIANNWLTLDNVLSYLTIQHNDELYISALKVLTCHDNNQVQVLQSVGNSEKMSTIEYPHLIDVNISCSKCSANAPRGKLTYVSSHKINESLSGNQKLCGPLKEFVAVQLFVNPRIAFIANHLDYCDFKTEDFLQQLFCIKEPNRLQESTISYAIAKCVDESENFLQLLSSLMLTNVADSLQSKSRNRQRTILQIIVCCAYSGKLSEQWLFYMLKMTFFYLIHPESTVVDEAILCGSEICNFYNTQPIQLWNWYKRDALGLIVRLMVYVYLQKGVRITNSLNALTKMLGFSCSEEFVCKYYRLLVTMILSYSVKEPRCKGLIIGISKITRKSVVELFLASFLRIYTHIYLTETPDIGNACIELIGKCTGASLSKLMNTDIQQTVCEILVYFNRSPTFVMQAFKCLLPNEITSTSANAAKSSTHEFTEFIKIRFLGVITYFQTCLAEPHFERTLKEETLYSLGQIMRLIGTKNVTEFRFKIIATLTFVLTIEDRNLRNICLKIWKIFLHIVSIQELGPSLSRIVASLLPLMNTNGEDVNEIYDYLIQKNDSLLGVYIPDLYYLETMPKVKPVVRQLVARQTDFLKAEPGKVHAKLSFLYKQICNENLQVRIYGLNYLAKFIAQHRVEINGMILGNVPVDPLIEGIVDELMKGCRHSDRNMHLSSARCLGELGAIDPGYMSANFSFMDTPEISLSIHTDDFAIMALTELCRAYQFQKDSKYVDNFSLAIQETLSVFGISPEEKKKLNVWDAMPERMQQIMRPLLTSCYTGSKRQTKSSDHPLFNSSSCRSFEEWSFLWTCRLIDLVEKEDTRHLLNSYKLGMKRDSKILALFFPYILVHVLQECQSNGQQQIFEEFMAVLNFYSRDAAAMAQVDTSGYKEFKSAKYSADKTGNEHSEKSSGSNASELFEGMEAISQTCIKHCSEQIDFLQRWIKEWRKANMVGGKHTQEDDKYKTITQFVDRFDKSLIARANYNSGEFARALLYLEEYIEEEPAQRLQEQLSFLIQIYGKLADSDSVEGAVYMKKTNLSLEEEILVNRIVDHPQETITCYEQLLSQSDCQIKQDHIKGIIECYLRMDTPETALLITDGLWQKLADQYTDDYFKECKSELLWRLGRYDELQELLEDSVVRKKTTNWNIQCAESFLLFRQPQSQTAPECATFSFVEQLDTIRCNIVGTMRSCAGVTGNLYAHSYDEATRLHLLNEVESNKQLIIRIQSLANEPETLLTEVKNFFSNWDDRLEILQPSAGILEPILCFRRNLLSETRNILQQQCDMENSLCQIFNEQMAKLWLRSIQMNRESGCLQQAQISIMKAEAYKPPTLFLEKARLLWQKGDQTNCFKLLQKNIDVLLAECDSDIRKLDRQKRVLYAEANILQACYNAESMNICPELNLRYFKEAVTGNRTSEKCLVYYAQYMEKIYESFTKEQKESENGCNFLVDIMLNYAKSLKYGCSKVYQSLPRLLSIWLNFTSDLVPSSEANNSKIALLQAWAKKMNDLINNCVLMLPASVFYTAFSQLLSRICHPSSDVFNCLRNIFCKLIEHFPQQSLWMLLPVFKSCHNTRAKRCRLLFTDARLSKSDFQKLLSDFNMLAERLIELTNKDLALDKTYELSTLVRQLPRFFQDRQFSKIMLPFEKYMQASFPIATTADNLKMTDSSATNPEAALAPTNPFPACVYISGISEEVVVLRSAAKPKKITITCSDGLSYNIMVKPKDDLRKDFRLMEFNGLVKRYLHQDPQARHRRLRIRTYAAIPFNEECGLVEWLPNLNSFRNICMSHYRTRGLGIADRMLRQCALPKTESIEKKRAMFKDVLLTRHPPVFHEWFRQRFPSPHSWYQARSAYIKTTAVMSMVGYILGLGDRHGENILFDENNGDAVHVDFNCLFNQGETFAYPEVVPFRLTHNMTFAMGPLGVEGLYRRCCEITLRVLKDESKTLMSVLRPFVYDIGSINRLKSKASSSLEMTDPKAITDVKRIEERLQGYIKRTQGCNMPLSTEGQVNFLINEATDIDNLASMYIGWGSFI